MGFGGRSELEKKVSARNSSRSREGRPYQRAGGEVARPGRWMDLRPHGSTHGEDEEDGVLLGGAEVGPAGRVRGDGFNVNGPRSFWGYWRTLGYGQLECAKLFSSSQRQN